MKKKEKDERPPEEAERRQARNGEQTNARRRRVRLKLKESTTPTTLAGRRAKNYEAALTKRVQNDDQLYSGPDAVPGETVGNRRRRLEAQRVRERRRQLRKQSLGKSVKDSESGDNQTLSTGEEKIRQRLRRRIATCVSNSILTEVEKGFRKGLLQRRGKSGSAIDDGRSSVEEETAWKRLFMSQLESDFNTDQKNLTARAIEVELGPRSATTKPHPPHTTPSDDNVVVKIERDEEDENESQEESVRDWLARMVASSESESEEAVGERPGCLENEYQEDVTPAEVQERISQLKAAYAQNQRAKELQRLQSVLESARRRWVTTAHGADDATRAALDGEREAMTQRVYEDKRRLISTAYSQLAQKSIQYSQESEKQRKERLQEALLQPRLPKNKANTTTCSKTKSMPRLPLDDSDKAIMAQKSRIRNKLRRAEYSLYCCLVDILACQTDGPPSDTSVTEFETLLISRDNPSTIQFWALVRTTKDKYPEVVSSYRRSLYDLLSSRIRVILSRPSSSRRRVDTTPILPLYEKLYPEEQETREPELIPVSSQQSRNDFQTLKEFIQSCDGEGTAAFGSGLRQHLRPKRNIEGKWERIKSDPARHEHFKALKRRWHHRKKNGIELELGTYLTVAAGKGRRMINSKTEGKKPEICPGNSDKPPRTRKVRSDAGKKKKKNLVVASPEDGKGYQEQRGHPFSATGPLHQSGSGGGQNHSYSGSNSVQDPELDGEFGWLPMDSGVQLGGFPPNYLNQQVHVSYFQSQQHLSSPSTSCLPLPQGTSKQFPTPHFYQSRSSPHPRNAPGDQQRLGWNLSNQSQNIQNQSNYPNSSFASWNPPSHSHSQDQNQPEPTSPLTPNSSRATNTDSPPHYSTSTPRLGAGRARGRPRKGEERKKTPELIKKRKSAPVLLAADAELPPPLHLEHVSENAGMPLEAILPKCPHCQDVIVGPLELEKHIKKLHPPSSHPTTPVSSESVKNDNGLLFPCRSCSSSFKNPFSLISHIFLSHYPGKEYGCPIGRRIAGNATGRGRRCAKNDVRYDRHGLRVHLPLVHPEEIRGTWILGINAIRVVDKAVRFLCLQCDETTLTYSELASHYASTHGKIRYGCEYCGIYLREDDLLREHIQLFHPQRPCPSCPTPLNLDAVAVFPCSICDSEFSSESFLRTHTSSGHSFLEEEMNSDGSALGKCKNKGKIGGASDESVCGYAAAPYKCEICPRSYLSLGSLRLHSTRRHKLYKILKNLQTNGPEDCSERRSTAPDNQSGNLTKPSPLPLSPSLPDFSIPISCHLCSYSAPGDTFHSLHLGYDAYLRTFCGICSKTFPSSASFALHSQSEHGASLPCPSGKLGGVRPKGLYPEQWLTCGVCSRGFTHPEYHSIHTIFQQGLGSAVACKSCPKVYPSRYLLRNHVKSEHGDTFKGRRSSVEVTTSNNSRPLLESDFERLIISTEVKSTAGTRILFTCKVCLKSYKMELFARTHISGAHAEDAFRRVWCSKCSSTFSCRDNLRKHEKVAHSDSQTRFRCPCCPAVFERMHNVKKHFKGEHAPQTFSVKDVTKFLAPPDQDQTDAGNKLSCNICYAKFTTKVSMKRHVAQQHFSIHINTFCEGCGLQLHPSLMASHSKKCKNLHAPATKSSGPNSKSGNKKLSIQNLLGQVMEIYTRMESLELEGILRFSQNSRRKAPSSCKVKIQTKTKRSCKPQRPSRGGPGPKNKSVGIPRKSCPIPDSDTETEEEVWSEDENISKLSINHVNVTPTRTTRSSSKGAFQLDSPAATSAAGEDEEEEEWDWNDMIIKQEEISDISEEEEGDFSEIILPDGQDDDGCLKNNPHLIWSDEEESSSSGEESIVGVVV